jgi:hypothetical protein
LVVELAVDFYRGLENTEKPSFYQKLGFFPNEKIKFIYQSPKCHFSNKSDLFDIQFLSMGWQTTINFQAL